MTDLALTPVEVVQHGTSLAIPRPADVTDVYDLCARVESMLSAVDDIMDAYDAKAKFAAIDTYLAQTSKDGRARLAATMRRLEARIGELLGVADNGGRRESGVSSFASELTPNERHQFRQMAAHPEVVEQVIAESDDHQPASRSKVLAAIRDSIQATETESVMQRTGNTGRAEQIRTLASLGMSTQQIADDLGLTQAAVSGIAFRAGIAVGQNSRQAVAERVETARRMAAEGHTSDQIGAAIGVDSMTMFKKRHGIEVPADAVVGKRRNLDSNRIVGATVAAVTGIDSLFDAIDYTALDRTELDHWISSLSDAIRSLTTLRNNLRKELTQ